MPYLGNSPAEAYSSVVKDSFNGDGSTTAFTMSQPSATNNVRVVVENVIQDPTVAYSCNGTTLTFTSAPPTGTANIYVVHLGPATQTAVPPSEINNATTYTSDLTVQGAFTSQGIDDNADATAMTIDSSENVLVGTTTRTNLSNGTGNTGHSLDNAGQARHTADSGEVMFLNRLTDDGDIAVFRKDGSTVGSIASGSGRLAIGDGDMGLRFVNASTERISPYNISTLADKDNAIDLGETSARFDDIFATNGTIQTSDANEKQDVAELDEAERRVATAAKGLIRKYRWIDSVEAKGDDARIHVGVIAQDLQAAFEAEGLDPGRYAMFISSTWWEADETYTDDEGVEQTRTKTYDTAEEAPEGAVERTRLGVRYNQLLAFIIGAM